MPEIVKKTKNSDASLKVQELKALRSKIKGLVSHQEALIQKKLRIDLEIKKTQAKLRKIQKKSRTLSETHLSLNESTDLHDPKTLLRFLQEATPVEAEAVELISDVQASQAQERMYHEIESYLYVPSLS